MHERICGGGKDAAGYGGLYQTFGYPAFSYKPVRAADEGCGCPACALEGTAFRPRRGRKGDLSQGAGRGTDPGTGYHRCVF